MMDQKANRHWMPVQEPHYQTHWRRILFLLGGFGALGAILDAVTNARELITPISTFVGTGLILAVVVFVQVLLPRIRLRWVVPGPQTVYLKSLGMQPVWFAFGIILLLWVPRIAELGGWLTHKRDTSNDAVIEFEWAEVLNDVIEYIDVEMKLDEGTIRAGDFRSLLVGFELHFGEPASLDERLPYRLKFGLIEPAGDLQKSLNMILVDQRREERVITEAIRLSRTFSESSEPLCWWHSDFISLVEDNSCAAEAVGDLTHLTRPFLVKDMLSFSSVYLRSALKASVQYTARRGASKAGLPLQLDVTLRTRRGALHFPIEQFNKMKEIDEKTKGVILVYELSGSEILRAFRRDFFEQGGLKKATTEAADDNSEVYLETHTIKSVMKFFPRFPTDAEWKKYRKLHPEFER